MFYQSGMNHKNPKPSSIYYTNVNAIMKDLLFDSTSSLFVLSSDVHIQKVAEKPSKPIDKAPLASPESLSESQVSLYI